MGEAPSGVTLEHESIRAGGAVAGYFQLACPKTDSTENSGGNSLSVGFACFSLLLQILSASDSGRDL